MSNRRTKPSQASVLTMAIVEMEDTFQNAYERGQIDLRLCNEVHRFGRMMDRRIANAIKRGVLK